MSDVHPHYIYFRAMPFRANLLTLLAIILDQRHP